MSKPDGSPSAVIVSGGKQYRVAPGDRILVDRIGAELGASLKLGVLLFSDGEGVKVGNPGVDGVDVDARVIAHQRGPRTEAIRYKSKKRVRVHRGGRSYLTALEIIAVGGVGLPEKEEEAGEKPKKGRAKAAPKKKPAAKAEVKAEAPEAAAEAEETAEKPKRTRRTKQEREK